jgi:multiple sugar transport system substrate-binding protein
MPDAARPNHPRRGRRTRSLALGAVLALGSVGLAACGGGDSGTPTLNWYINPDSNDGQAKLAAKCTAASGGRYRVVTSTLPNDADAQREQLVRRLAAKDKSVDLMSLDVVFAPEFFDAGFLRPFSEQDRQQLTEGILDAPVESATWRNQLVVAPFWANTQLMWYRKSVAQQAGLDPTKPDTTWDEVIAAAKETSKTVEVQGGRYEGYMVLVNALLESAGGSVLEQPEAGRDAVPSISSPAGQRAATIVRSLATGGVANPALSTAREEDGRAAFQGDTGGFLMNWPYVYGAAQEAVTGGSLDKAVLDDIGWARYPRAVAEQESTPPLGGINIGIGAYTRYPAQAVEAVKCLTTQESQTEYMLTASNPAAHEAVYDDPEVIKKFPMAALIRESINAAAPRPLTPYYGDVTAAVQRTWHPPASVTPQRTPPRSAKLIQDVLKDKVLL